MAIKQDVITKDFVAGKWQKEIDCDRFYNPNYSLHHPFMLNEKKK